MNIGEMTVDQISAGVQSVLLDHMKELKEAYAASEEPFTISITAKIKPVPEGNRIDIGLNFVIGRVRNAVIRIVNENQMSFLDEFKKGNVEISVGGSDHEPM